MKKLLTLLLALSLCASLAACNKNESEKTNETEDTKASTEAATDAVTESAEPAPMGVYEGYEGITPITLNLEAETPYMASTQSEVLDEEDLEAMELTGTLTVTTLIKVYLDDAEITGNTVRLTAQNPEITAVVTMEGDSADAYVQLILAQYEQMLDDGWIEQDDYDKMQQMLNGEEVDFADEMSVASLEATVLLDADTMTCFVTDTLAKSEDSTQIGSYEYENGKVAKESNLELYDDEDWSSMTVSFYAEDGVTVLVAEEYEVSGTIEEYTVGNIFRRTEYYEDGSEKKISSYEDGELVDEAEYDENGNEIKWAYYEDGVVTEYTYEYDENGYLVKESCTVDGEFSYAIRYVCDDEGKVEEEFELDEDGNVTQRSVFEYNEEGLTTKVSFFDSEGDLFEYTVYEYDENGSLIKESRYDGQGNLVDEHHFTGNEFMPGFDFDDNFDFDFSATLEGI